MEEQTRIWVPGRPCAVARLLFLHRHGRGDPSHRTEGATTWKAMRSPEGVVTLALRERPAEGTVEARAWGPGAVWALDAVPRLLGDLDDPSGFDPELHPVVAAAHRAHPHFRIGHTGLVLDALVPVVIEQKVTGQEAFAGYRRLVQWYGEPAPGPHPSLRVPPSAARVATIPSWEWLRMHIDQARSRTIVRAAALASSLERTVGLDHAEADRRLRSLPGIGVWTSAEIRVRAHGDPDAVSFGDYHVAKDLTWALTGEIGDDDRMAEVLEPWRPHRYRVQALLALAGHHRPRRGPRMAPRTHLPTGRSPGTGVSC